MKRTLEYIAVSSEWGIFFMSAGVTGAYKMDIENEKNVIWFYMKLNWIRNESCREDIEIARIGSEKM